MIYIVSNYSIYLLSDFYLKPHGNLVSKVLAKQVGFLSLSSSIVKP